MIYTFSGGSPPIQCRQSQDGASSRVAGAEIGRIGREQGTSLKVQGAGEMCENSGIYGDILWDLQELDTINGFRIANFIVFLENWKFHRENRASPMDLGPMNGIFQGKVTTFLGMCGSERGSWGNGRYTYSLLIWCT